MRLFLEAADVTQHVREFGSTVVKATVDAVLDDVRASVAGEGAVVPPFAELLARVRDRLARQEDDGLVEVLNGTGILLHTNLGRAPLAAEALAAMRAIGAYSNLEYDVRPGTRGSRYARVTTLLRAATGAEDALVVNNCAAAVLLILDTFARSSAGSRREVVVSRNQLVEIGGGFRLPDVLARSGATLVEVGTTNRVYLRDFERALTSNTALLLRSHTSNYRIVGFTADVSGAELASLGKRAGIPTVEDLGSGALVDLVPFGLPHERTVGEALADGIDLVAFSGDKLLGGPQAGIVAGSTAAIARLRANPLLRALRVDKATLAALAATLRLYLEPGALTRVPFYAMLATPVDDLRARVRKFLNDNAELAGHATGIATQAYAGGGSAPAAALPSYGVALRGAKPNALAARLRTGRPRIVPRVEENAVIVDFRTLAPERDGEVGRAVCAAVAAGD